MGQVFGVNGADNSTALNLLRTSENPVEQSYAILAEISDDSGENGITITLGQDNELRDSGNVAETNSDDAVAVLGQALAANDVRTPEQQRHFNATARRFNEAVFTARESRHDLPALQRALHSQGLTLEALVALSDHIENPNDMQLDLLIERFFIDNPALAAVYNTERRAPATAEPPAAAGQPAPVTDVQEFLLSRGVEFTFTDMTNDGTVDWADVLATIDTSGNGEISLTELNNFISSRGGTDAGRISRALYNLIDNGMVAGRSSGNGQLSQAEFLHAISVMQEYADIIGASFEEVVEAYNGEDSYTNEDFADLHIVRDRANTGITAYCEDHQIELTSNLSPEQARDILASLGYSAAHIDAVMAYFQEQIQRTADFLEDCIMRLVEAGRRNQDSFGMRVSDLPFFPGELESTAVQRSTSTPRADAITGWLQGEEFDLTQYDGALDDDDEFQHIFGWDVVRGGASQQRQLLGTYIRSLLENGQYGMAERVMQLVGDENGEYFIARAASDGQIHGTFANIYTGNRRFESAARHANHMSGNEQTRAYAAIVDGAIVDRQLELAYRYVSQVNNSQESQRLLRDLVGACISGNNHSLSRVARLDLAWRILRSPAYAFNDREDLLLRLVKIYSSNNSGGRQEDGSVTREVRRTAVEILQWMITDEGDGLGYGNDYQVQVPGQNGQRQDMALQDYLIQLEDGQAMPVEITRIRASVLSRNGQPVISAIPSAISDLYEIYTTANTAIEGQASTLSPTELRQHRINRAYALRALAEIYRAQRDFDWNRIPPNERNGDYANNFQDSDCYNNTITMARLAREATLAFRDLEQDYPDQSRRFQEEGITANSITADVIYDVAELYAGAHDGNPQGFAAHEDYRTHYRRAFQAVVRFLIPGPLVRVTNRRGETEEMQSITVFRRVGNPERQTRLGADEHDMPPIEEVTAAAELRRSGSLNIITSLRSNLNDLQNLNSRQMEERDSLVQELETLEASVRAVEGDDTELPEELTLRLRETERRINNEYIPRVDRAAARRQQLARTGQAAIAAVNAAVDRAKRQRHLTSLPPALRTRKDAILTRLAEPGTTYGDILSDLNALLGAIAEADRTPTSGNPGTGGGGQPGTGGGNPGGGGGGGAQQLPGAPPIVGQPPAGPPRS